MDLGQLEHQASESSPQIQHQPLEQPSDPATPNADTIIDATATQQTQPVSSLPPPPSSSPPAPPSSSSNKHYQETDLLAAMEFTKNYSDELLGQERSLQPIEADLAEFELNSSPDNEYRSSKSFEPTSKRKSSASRIAATPAAEHVSNSEPTAIAPNLKSLKDSLLSSFDQFADVFYWKKPVDTGIIFATGLLLLLAFMYLSIISVVAYSALGLIFASSLMRLYRAVMGALNKSSETPFDHIWDKALSTDLSISSKTALQFVNSINATVLFVKSVILVEDKIATLKFGSFLFALTFLGSWFNGLTLIMLSYIALFSGPVIYKQNKTVIDANLKLLTDQTSSIISDAKSKVSSLVGSGVSKQSAKKDS